MSRQIQLRRGTDNEHRAFTGAIGELTMDTTNNTLRLHDGTTPGGIKMARADEVSQYNPIPDTADYVIETQHPTSTNNYTWYRKYKSGWVEQGGHARFDTITTLPIAMADSNYNMTITAASGIGGSGTWTQDRTPTSFKCCGQNYGGQFVSSGTMACWHISGFGA